MTAGMPKVIAKAFSHTFNAAFLVWVETHLASAIHLQAATVSGVQMTALIATSCQTWVVLSLMQPSVVLLENTSPI